jgi:guanylate kinase
MVVISGASGAGKGTIVSKVMKLAETAGERKVLSRSWTTRPQRPGEPDEAYYFVTREEFEQNVASGGFLEFAEFNGNYYGTPRPNENSGQLIAEIETQGAGKLKDLATEQGVDTQFQYVVAATPQQLESQLFSRDDGVDKAEKKKRLGIFYEDELTRARELGAHVVVNTNPDVAALKSYAATNGIYFCDPTLAEVIGLYEEARQHYLADSE